MQIYKTEQPGIRVENSGTGVAWNGKITITAFPSKANTEYGFTRLYGRSEYEFPSGGASPLLFDKSRDSKIKVVISYKDEEKGGKQYDYEGEFQLQREWLD